MLVAACRGRPPGCWHAPAVHNVIVSALCSCYPRPILGNSSEWYRTPNYRRRIVR